MPTPPYPLHPQPIRKGWLELHPQWKIPLGGVILVLLVGGFGIVVMTAMMATYHRSEVYQQAVAKAVENPQVQAEIGEPLRPAWLISGDLHVGGSTGNANLSIPISGPRGRGVIRAVAVKNGGVWRFTYLQVNVAGQRAGIDLMSIQPPLEREF
jgi:hypothetical protein